MKVSGIYKIQSVIKPNRIYIGSAVNISRRWDMHLSTLRRNKHDNQRLQNHYNKYGEEDLSFEILLGCDKDNLVETEQYFIDFYNAYKYGFNMRPHANNNVGYKPTEETRKRISEALIGNQYSLGCKHTEEFCKKSSENRKKNWQSSEYRRKVSEGLKRSHKERGDNNSSIMAIKRAVHNRWHKDVSYEDCPICHKDKKVAA